jgi:hypothetical protein
MNDPHFRSAGGLHPRTRVRRWRGVLAGGLLLSGHVAAALPPGNLLANPSGMEEANVGWTITAGPLAPPSYNTGWKKDGNIGVPDFSATFLRHGFGGTTTYRPGFFRTSYSPNKCLRNQQIDLIEKGATRGELDAQPEIKVGEWISSFSANGTTADTFVINVKLIAEDGVTELAAWTVDNTTAGGTPNNWTLFEHTFTGYGPGLRYIRFEDGGWDGGFWAGQYGSFHDEAFVEFTADSDGDGLPDAVEAAYGGGVDLLPEGDADADEVTNLEEYLFGTGIADEDSDGDGLPDGEEIFNQTQMLIADTDGDGLSDGEEVNDHGSDPRLADTDNDGFSDYAEVTAVPSSDPNDPGDAPGGITTEKRFSLVGSDLTDPENDGLDTSANGSGFNWSAIQASVNGTFLGTNGEGAYSVFDNRLGGSGSKWLVASLGTGPWVQVKFDTLTSLTGFALSSGNDAPERDPLVWEIQGSLDDVNSNPGNWTTIYRWDQNQPPWAPNERLTTYSVTLPKKTLPYRWIRFQVFSVRSGATFQLDEIEYFGEQSNADGDGDGIPKLVEDFYDFLDDTVPADALADEDGDDLDNLAEYLRKTKLSDPDSDGDGLLDGAEVNLHGSDPLRFDTDGDGLGDYEEAGPGGYGTDPALADTDGDGFSDFAEINSIPPTDPTSAASAPYKITVLGTGSAALIGGDATDPENDINDNLTTGGNAGSGFNWVATYTNSTKNYFNGPSQTTGTNEGVLNLFDNKVGGGEAKWCCEAAPRFITVEFAAPVSLAYFTLASGNDSLERSPSEWEIAGSNDNVNFTTILADTSPGTHHWTDFNQVLRFDLNEPSPPYKFIKFTVGDTAAVTNPVTNAIQFSEIEYFTAPTGAPVVVGSDFNAAGDFQIEVDGLAAGTYYQLYRSLTLEADWAEIGAPVQATGAEGTFIDESPPPVKAFYRIEDVPPP